MERMQPSSQSSQEDEIGGVVESNPSMFHPLKPETRIGDVGESNVTDKELFDHMNYFSHKFRKEARNQNSSGTYDENQEMHSSSTWQERLNLSHYRRNNKFKENTTYFSPGEGYTALNVQKGDSQEIGGGGIKEGSYADLIKNLRKMKNEDGNKLSDGEIAEKLSQAFVADFSKERNIDPNIVKLVHIIDIAESSRHRTAGLLMRINCAMMTEKNSGVNSFDPIFGIGTCKDKPAIFPAAKEGGASRLREHNIEYENSWKAQMQVVKEYLKMKNIDTIKKADEHWEKMIQGDIPVSKMSPEQCREKAEKQKTSEDNYRKETLENCRNEYAQLKKGPFSSDTYEANIAKIEKIDKSLSTICDDGRNPKQQQTAEAQRKEVRDLKQVILNKQRSRLEEERKAVKGEFEKDHIAEKLAEIDAKLDSAVSTARDMKTRLRSGAPIGSSSSTGLTQDFEAMNVGEHSSQEMEVDSPSRVAQQIHGQGITTRSSTTSSRVLSQIGESQNQTKRTHPTVSRGESKRGRNR